MELRHWAFGKTVKKEKLLRQHLRKIEIYAKVKWLFFIYFQSILLDTYRRLRQDSKSDSQSRRRGHWPLDHHHGPTCSTYCLQMLTFLMGHPRPLFHLFSSFQTNFTIFTTNKCEKCPSSIRCWDSNPWP